MQGCYNVGNVNGKFYVGGIVGESSGSGNTIWIKDCYNKGSVIGNTIETGGIGGYISYSLVENCYSQATVSGNTNVGGICGNSNKVDFQNAYYDSNLYTGDAIGYLKDATIKQTEGKSSQAFESGEIAYLLQADREEPVWGQTLSGNDVQTYPVLGGAKVYQVTEYKGCIESTGIAGTTYNNANAPVFEPHVYENGFCTICSAYEPAVLTTGKYDIDVNGEITDSDEAYEIGNAGQLYWFAGLVNGTLTDGTAQNLKANAVLTADITVNEDLLTSINTDKDGNVTNGTSFRIWLPMGKINANNGQQMVYAGIFDGKEHSISGLYANLYDVPVEDPGNIYINKNRAGLFGLYAGVTRNLRILDSYMRGEHDIGGICGRNEGGTIQNCYSAATVCGDSYIGGICGRSRSNSIIENCYNAGNVYGNGRSIGGICGYNFSIIENCYNVGKVNGKFYVGGIVGESSGYDNTIWIKDCYNRGNVIGDTKDIGGIGGYIGSSLVENCYSQATVSGNTNVGGICGNSNKVDFQNAYYDSNLYTGDAIGYLKDATIKQTEGKSSQAFESGEIAYLLQADREEPVWGQTLSGNDVQTYPVLGGAKVYQVTEYKGCIESTGIAGTTYNNANAPVFEPHVYENGFCTICSAYEPAVLTTGKYDIDVNGEITDSDEAYEIGNAGQLYWFAGLVNGTLTDGTAQNLKANAVLTADIIVNKDLLTSINTDDDGNVTNGSSFKAWRPMGMADEKGNLTGWYTGIFDGNGHSISGLYVNRDEAADDVHTWFKSCIGLFGYYSGVTRNLSVLDSYMRGKDCIGGICGYNDGGTIQNCYSAATVCGDSYIGGICGRSEGDSIIDN